MYLNHSRASTFNLCRRKYAYAYWLNGGLRPKQEDKRLVIGIAVHAGLEHFYLNHTPEESAQLAKDEYLAMRTKHWGGLLLDEWEKDADLVYRMVLTYGHRTQPKDDFSIIDVEGQFCVVLGEVCYKCGELYQGYALEKKSCYNCAAPLHYWVGTYDLLVNRAKDGESEQYAIADHKTTANTPNEDFLQGFSRSFQLIGYVYGTEKSTGLSIRQYGVNALQKAATIGTDAAEIKTCGSCRNGSKKKLTCSECGGSGKVEKAVKLDPFRRRWFKLTDADVDRFIMFALSVTRSIQGEIDLFETEPEAAFPMNDRGCGLGPCPYMMACWENQNVLRWFDVDPVYLEGLDAKGTDYVEEHAAIALEEKS